MTVSIVIPFYNAARTLGETIQSALDQTGVDLDVVLVDDGSSDGSLAIAQGFCPVVRVFTGPNRGVSAARNRGIAESRADWIVFLDSDDLLLPGTLKARLGTAAATGADVIICDWQDLIDHNGSTVMGPTKSIDLDALSSTPEIACATHAWATTAALMYRRSLIEKIGGFRNDLLVIQDARLLFDAAYHGARFAHAAHVGAHYRVVPDSLSRRDPRQFYLDVFNNGKQIEAMWRARGDLSDAQRGALAEIYDAAARQLFAACDADYFEAVHRERSMGLRLPLHTRIGAPLASTIGLRGASRVFKLLGR